MSMNKVKRFWPALALAPVLALAVYLSVSLLAGGPPPPALAQGLPAGDMPSANTVPGQCGVKADMVADGARLILKDGHCTTSADSLPVVFQNTNPAADLPIVVYVTGGADFPRIDATATSTGDTTRMLGKRGINEAQITLDRQDGFGVPGQHTITVTRSMADDTGAVYLFAYRALNNAGDMVLTSTGIPFPTDATGFPGDETVVSSMDHLADFAIKVQFLDAGVPDAEESSLAAVDPASGETESEVTIMVKNMAGDGLTGFMDLTLEGGDDAYFDIANRPFHRVQIVEGEPATDVTVKGLPETGAVRAKVTGVFRGLTLSDHITRTVDTPEAVVVKAYACAMEAEEIDGICANESANLANDSDGDDPAELTYVAPGGSFLIAGHAEDPAGNRVYGALSWAGANAAANAALAVNSGTTNAATEPAEPTDPAANPDTATIAVAADAPAGEYRLTVSDSGDNVSVDLRFYVSGPPANYALAGPTRIGLNSYGEYTVTATDADGYPPHFAADGSDRCVDIRVRGSRFREADDLEFLQQGQTSCTGLALNTATGKGVFVVNAPLAVTHGSEATVQVWLDSDLQVAQDIAFANAPENNTVNSAAPGMATVTWGPVFGATVHWIWSVKPGNIDGKYTRAAGDAGTVTIDDLDSGDQYYFIVIAGSVNADGTVAWSWWSNWATTTVQ